MPKPTKPTAPLRKKLKRRSPQQLAREMAEIASAGRAHRQTLQGRKSAHAMLRQWAADWERIKPADLVAMLEGLAAELRARHYAPEKRRRSTIAALNAECNAR